MNNFKQYISSIFFYLSIMSVVAQVNHLASTKTKKLYHNLKWLPKGNILFGHQDDLAYGVGWKGEFGRSDVKDVSGMYPAVFGWDVGGLEKNANANLDGVPFEHMKKLIKYAYKQGGINTISWHMDNPVSKGNSWDTTTAVDALLPNGKLHGWYKEKLDKFAEFCNELTVDSLGEEKIPILFRPFHEHTGSWFWWGKGHCTVRDYINLFRFTVDYLVKVKALHQLLFVYSPDIFETKEGYLECYPGDKYVDVLGLDNYHDLGINGKQEDFERRMLMLSEIALSCDKPYALTETGLEGVKQEDWWTDKLYAYLSIPDLIKTPIYVLVWRNANSSHHYAPYVGHKSQQNFILFKDKLNVLFCGEYIDFYK